MSLQTTTKFTLVPHSPCSPVRCRPSLIIDSRSQSYSRRRFVATTMPFCLTRIVRWKPSLCSPVCPAAVAHRKAATHRRWREAPEAEGMSHHRRSDEGGPTISGQRSRKWSSIRHRGILGDDSLPFRRRPSQRRRSWCWLYGRIGRTEGLDLQVYAPLQF
jgi:hypothetical protein